jgi:hypothetical protein
LDCYFGGCTQGSTLLTLTGALRWLNQLSDINCFDSFLISLLDIFQRKMSGKALQEDAEVL